MVSHFSRWLTKFLSVVSVCFLKLSFETTDLFLAVDLLVLTVATTAEVTCVLIEGVAVFVTGATKVAFDMIFAFVKLKNCDSAFFCVCPIDNFKSTRLSFNVFLRQLTVNTNWNS